MTRLRHSRSAACLSGLLTTCLLTLSACDSASESDGGQNGRLDGRTADARTGDARLGDARPGDARLGDARPPVDATPGGDVSLPDAAVAEPCPENIALRCFTPAGSLPMGQTSGVVVRAVRWEGDDRVLLQHRGNGATEAVGWSLCNAATCVNLPTMTLESGRWVTVHLDAAGTDSAAEVFLGVGALPLTGVGELAVYRTAEADQRNAGTLERFVAWGAPVPDSRASDASGAARWTSGVVPVCVGAVGLVVVGASDRPTGYRAQPDSPAACGDSFR